MIVFFIIALIFLLLSSGAGAFDYLKRNSASNSQSTEETRSQSPTTIPASTVPKCAKSDFFVMNGTLALAINKHARIGN